MCCDLAGSVRSRQHWLWDIARKINEFLLFSFVPRILQLLITLEPLDQFKWGFQWNVPLQMSTSIKSKTENVTCAGSEWFPKITSHIENQVFSRANCNLLLLIYWGVHTSYMYFLANFIDILNVSKTRKHTWEVCNFTLILSWMIIYSPSINLAVFLVFIDEHYDW